MVIPTGCSIKIMVQSSTSMGVSDDKFGFSTLESQNWKFHVFLKISLENKIPNNYI